MDRPEDRTGYAKYGPTLYFRDKWHVSEIDPSMIQAGGVGVILRRNNSSVVKIGWMREVMLTENDRTEIGHIAVAGRAREE